MRVVVRQGFYCRCINKTEIVNHIIIYSLVYDVHLWPTQVLLVARDISLMNQVKDCAHRQNTEDLLWNAVNVLHPFQSLHHVSPERKQVVYNVDYTF